MARQVSIIKLSGSIGGLNFYKSPDGHLARTKPGVTKERMRTDPMLVRVRENGWEFGRAARSGKLMRHVFRSFAADVSDRLVSSRMQTCLLAVLRTDPYSRRGERTVSTGDIQLVKGFNFNIKSNFDTVFHGNYQAVIDTQTGQASLSIAGFFPPEQLEHPRRATHFKISIATAQVDFTTAEMSMTTDNTGALRLNDHCPDILMTAALPPLVKVPQFLAVKITFYQEAGGKLEQLNNMKYSPATILEVAYSPPELSYRTLDKTTAEVSEDRCELAVTKGGEEEFCVHGTFSHHCNTHKSLFSFSNTS